MKSIKKTFKSDSVEVDILDYTPGKGAKRNCRIHVPRDSFVISECSNQIMNYLSTHGYDPGFLIVGWKTYVQLELECDLEEHRHSWSKAAGYAQHFGVIKSNGLMYVLDTVIVADPSRDFYIKAFPHNRDAVDSRPEDEKIIEEFKELAIQAIESGIGINELRKAISGALVHKVLDH